MSNSAMLKPITSYANDFTLPRSKLSSCVGCKLLQADKDLQQQHEEV